MPISDKKTVGTLVAVSTRTVTGSLSTTKPGMPAAASRA
jgi:hypothetical protein